VNETKREKEKDNAEALRLAEEEKA